MLFGVLGPVEVHHEGRRVPVGSARERFVLAMLLLNADRLTAVDALIDALWERPPPSARGQLHNLISNVRRRLRIGDEELILSSRSGYKLRLESHELDLLEFRRLSAAGRTAAAAGDHRRAFANLDKALSLWRGPALYGIGPELASGLRQSLHDERLTTVDAKLDAALALDLYEDLLRELPALINEHPYRESLHHKHMQALVGAGRSADALAEYRRVRRRFIDDLGVEPDATLRELEHQILRDEIITAPRRTPPPRMLRQLPPPCAVLTGRDTMLTEITYALRDKHDAAAPVALLVGPGGIGKTSLALTAAHALGDAFPDGQLFADLRGSQDRPGDPHAVVGRFLRALGVDGSMVPEDPAERVAMYRSQLAGKRVLVVLDDVVAESQVRPLLPGTPHGRVLVTSRHRLDALVDAVRWTVPALTTAAAVELLTRIVGDARISADPAAATAIVELCARLPLTVGIAAARLAGHTYWTLEEFRQRLAAERGRLDELAVGDLDVRASIALSYGELDSLQRKLFRRLGLLGSADWPTWVAGALLGVPDERGAWLLDFLVDAHLVEAVGRDAVGQSRFRLHDLVREFAAERALAEEPRAHRADALARVLSSWLALATEADERLPHDLVRSADPVAVSAPWSAARLACEQAVAWFEAERRNLVGAVSEACRLGRADIAGALALRLSGFLCLRSYYDDWEGTLRQAISQVRKDDRAEVLVRLLSVQFVLHNQRDRYAGLPAIAAEQLAMARALGDRELEVRALRHAGLAAERLGRYAEAIGWLERAVPAARHPDIADSLLRASLDTLAVAHIAAGYTGRAVPLLEEALDIDTTETLRTALLRYHYGQALTGLGRLTQAENALLKALLITRKVGHDLGSAYLEHTLADVHIRQGRWARAAARLDRAMAAHRKLGNCEGLALALRSSADLVAAEGRWTEAIGMLSRSLELLRAIGTAVEMARTLARLDRAYTANGAATAAAACRQEYRTILGELDLDDASLYLPPPHTTCDEGPVVRSRGVPKTGRASLVP